MPRFSGKYGAVNGESTIRNWVANITATPFVYSASNTRAGTARNKGVRDWTGNMQQLRSIPTLMPGDIFNFVGYIAPTSGDWGTVGPTKEGQAIVESVEMVWNWETNEPINSTINFAGVSPLVDGTGTITDVTLPLMEIPEGRWIKFGPASATPASVFSGDNKLINASRATLTFTATNSRFVDSDTGGWASRVKGKLDWTLDVTRNDVSLADRLFDIDDILTLVLPINATEYWAIRWGRVINFSGVTVDINEGSILQETVNFGMQAHHATLNVGSIRKPGGTVDYWPFPTG